MQLQKVSLGVVTLFMLAFSAAPANAQLGDLMNKAKGKLDKVQRRADNTPPQQPNDQPTDRPRQTNGGGNTQVSTRADTPMSGPLDWNQFRCSPEFTGAVNEARLREVIQYNLNNAFGKGGLIVLPDSR